MAWLLLEAFRQIYNQNQELKAEQKDSKTTQPGQKRSNQKPRLRRVWLFKRLTPLKRSQPLRPGMTENWPDSTHQRLPNENMSQGQSCPFLVICPLLCHSDEKSQHCRTNRTSA